LYCQIQTHQLPSGALADAFSAGGERTSAVATEADRWADFPRTIVYPGRSAAAAVAGDFRMLWPPPARGEGVVLRCACRATVLWRFPVAFVYLIRIVQHDHGCQARRASGTRAFVTLETIVSRDQSQTQAPTL
jgi:hypothetical protein